MSTSTRIDRPTRSGCCGQLLRIERDAHRHALHHLDPVAGGVLRRQQREGRAGAGAQADHLAVVLDVAAVDVGMQRHRLADAHAAQLHFLEVGVDPHLRSSGTTDISGVPAATRWPTCTVRLAT